ncbi:MAG: hypothetical protein WCW33_06265 [Candidatus Babeliales bacterium]|jgi:hypothetical protein
MKSLFLVIWLALVGMMTPHKVCADVPAPSDIPAPDIVAPDITAPAAPAPDAAPPQDSAQVSSPTSGGQEAPAIAQPLTGIDIISLSEQSPGIKGVDNPQIIDLYRKAVTVLTSMASVVDEPLEKRKKLYEEFFNLDAQLTDFFESSSLGKAMIKETLKADQAKQTAQHADVAAARLKLQAVDPEMVTKKKEKLKEILSSCDAEIVKMREIELDAHKNAMSVVNQQTTQAATAMFNKVNQQAKDLSAKSANVLKKIAQDFKTNAQEVRSLLQTFKEGLRTLQDSWAQAQAADEAALKTATEAAAAAKQEVKKQEQQVQPPAVPQKEQPVATPAQETFAHYVMRRMTDVAVGAWEVMHDTYQWFLERIGYAKPK